MVLMGTQSYMPYLWGLYLTLCTQHAHFGQLTQIAQQGGEKGLAWHRKHIFAIYVTTKDISEIPLEICVWLNDETRRCYVINQEDKKSQTHRHLRGTTLYFFEANSVVCKSMPSHATLYRLTFSSDVAIAPMTHWKTLIRKQLQLD